MMLSFCSGLLQSHHFVCRIPLFRLEGRPIRKASTSHDNRLACSGECMSNQILSSFLIPFSSLGWRGSIFSAFFQLSHLFDEMYFTSLSALPMVALHRFVMVTEPPWVHRTFKFTHTFICTFTWYINKTDMETEEQQIKDT